MDEQTKNLLTSFEQESLWKHKCHDVSARLLWTVNNWIGYPAAALSVIVGSAVFATLQTEDVPVSWRVAAVLLSWAAAALVAIQTQAKYGQRSEQHRVVAADYENLAREIKALKESPGIDGAEVREQVNHIRERLGQLTMKSPSIHRYARNAVGPPPPGVD